MTDTRSESPLRRMFVYGAIAAFIAFVVLIAASALSSSITPKVGFDLTVKIAERQVKAAGSTYLDDGRFRYEGGRLSFAGTIEGDQVKIEGKVVSPDQATTRPFRASGRIVDNRLRTAVNGSDGRRLGSFRLELPSDSR